MSGDNLTDEISKKRAVLGDVTNTVEKRGFSLVSRGLGLKPGGDTEDADMQLRKQICLGLENLVKEKRKVESSVDAKEKGLSVKKDSLPASATFEISQENASSFTANNVPEVKETSGLVDAADNSSIIGDSVTKTCLGVDDASRDSRVSRGTLPTYSEGNSQDGEDKEVIGSNPGLEGLVSQVFNSENKDIGFGRFAENKYESVERSRLQNAQDSKSFELERCTGLKGNACVNLEAGDDLLKACSCSFCLKAAYIWSDLHYQDIKGRISVLKKSQKEASLLVSKTGRGKQSNIHQGQGSSENSTNLESDLTSQWRSLFLHMEDIFAHESEQLHANFIMLKDMRENCKMDLERATGMPPERQ
ncbi:hypothetical protein HS088_TW05G00088 [Tripterygium wilfordii]|uniref:Uncharacterized protein n=1 Tax=Tripterygium wilfordii TaxID=458696 RepID=A0A7J7DM11_TRIWF|nr:uncharacterized protein LOC119998863 [Tripterygium wilfordii]XP_038702259.1 uncharacterized protein LOC119998863 [Tripterygium wilfordii]KAF5747367.1 hypothetical protein HS088_TW05G00088 [Tripterygium wilfordii]